MEELSDLDQSRSPALHSRPADALRNYRDEIAQRLAAIVESSEDAILTKGLDGTITSWNGGAERLFGYRASEIIGKPIMLLLPEDRSDEEARILARLRRGERVRHFETVRRRKDGSLVDISLSISPLRGEHGRIVGASTIARDISERKRAEEQQRLLLSEMAHRMKNLFALAASLVGMSARDAQSPQETASIAQERLSALARAHALTIPKDPTAGIDGPVGMHTLLETLLAPYKNVGAGTDRLRIAGDDLVLGEKGLTAVALILHELATNAAKYGALSSPAGVVTVECVVEQDIVLLIWKECGGPPTGEPGEDGFGNLLGRLVSRQLGGSIDREWRDEGLHVTLTIQRDRLG